MSILETPRLYFNGKCTWDPIVTNNTPNYWDLATSKPDQPLTSAKAYRDNVDNQIASNGNWNPQGTHRSVFYETRAGAVDTGSGRSTEDAIVNVPVNLSAMLVDIDPYVAITSQLFFDTMKIGIDGGPQIKITNDNGPFVGRYINFGRNPSLEIAGVASVVWQTSCVKGLQIFPHDSHLLQAFQVAIDAGQADGLTVRVIAYRTLYFDGPPPAGRDRRYQALEDRVKGGGFQPNPARSLIVGAVGLHRAGEPVSLPGDRQLSGNVGTAFARLDKTRLVIDLGNSIPEVNAQAKKRSFGDITVTAGDTNMGTLQHRDYGQKAYDETSGLVTLELNPSQVDAVNKGDITVTAPGLALKEQPLTAVIDPPNFYIEGLGTQKVQIQVLRNGVPVKKVTKLQIAEVARNPSSGILQKELVDTDANGKTTIEFSSESNAKKYKVFNGSSQWVFTPYEGSEPPVSNGVDTSTDCYLATRVTPADDDIASLPPTWQNVHQKVLIDWEALAPCMDNWLKLGDEQQCRAYAPLIKKLSSLDYFNNFKYMPVTRGLSKGQRTLLHNWCDAPAPPSPGATAEAAVESPMKSVRTGKERVDLSRGFSDLDQN